MSEQVNESGALPDSERIVVELTADRRQSEQRRRHLDDIFRRHRHDLCNLLRRMFGNGPPEPEDLVQGAFKKFAELDSIDHIENPRAFIARIAVNNGLKSIKRVQTARDYVAELLTETDAGLEKIDPERIYQGKQNINALNIAMAELSAKQREIVVRARLRGETYAQISKACGWSQADISRQLNRALKILADAIEPIEPIESKDR